ncbi:MAG TPA: Hsp20/alpha crystallin family protein [Blastocatellia bacterium]|nr:Hsp20/alpha crystallin family protein [Blastocatellia bacterium]
MVMYSYDQVLTDVRHVYEQLTGLPAPKIDVKNPRYPLPKGVDPVAFVQSEIDYLNLYLINSGISLRLSKVPTWTPPAEVYETPKEYVVNVELAGLTAEDVNIHQINNILIVRGTRRFRRASEDAQYHSTERVYGTFERLFPIPNYVRADDPEISFADGICEITLPKIEAAKAAAHEKETAAQKGGAQAKKK